MKTARAIRERIEALPAGEPFIPNMFLELGTRASVDQTLSRLTKAGKIERVTRGVFVRPKENRFVGKVLPQPFEVAKVLAQKTGATVQVHGAEAARQLELTTQMPVQSVFYTTGPSKHFRMGRLEVRLQHVASRKLAMVERPAGLAVAALWYLGKGQVTPSVIEKIRHKLPPGEFEALQQATSAMPAWMAHAVFQHQRSSRRV